MQPNRKTLIFLNLRFADFYSPELFIELKTQGHRVVAILDQQFQHKVGAHIAPFLDKVYHLDSNTKSGFLGEFNLMDLCAIVRIEQQTYTDLRIICTDEFNLLNAGQLRKEFNLPGHREEALLAFRDKTIMKTRVSTSGLRIPKFSILTSEDTYETVSRKLGNEFIVKPIDSCGSHGVYHVKTREEFNVAYQQYSTLKLQAEEFINGKLYHVDSCIRKGEILFMCANEYMHPNLDYTLGKPLGSIPLSCEEPLAKKLKDFARHCLQALQADDMINHMELFVTRQGEIVFLEVSGRPPGALLNLTHRINFGINLMDEDFMTQSDIAINTPKALTNKKAFGVLFPLSVGQIIQLHTPPAKSRCEMTWFAQLGDKVSREQCSNIVNKAAQAVFYHEDWKVLQSDFAQLKTHQVLSTIA